VILFAIGTVFVVGGVAAISAPAAAILFGLLYIALAVGLMRADGPRA